MVEENPGHRAASALQAMSIAIRHGFTTIRDLGTEAPAISMSAHAMRHGRERCPARGCWSRGPPSGRLAAIRLLDCNTA